jgi:hypothetical protein
LSRPNFVIGVAREKAFVVLEARGYVGNPEGCPSGWWVTRRVIHRRGISTAVLFWNLLSGNKRADIRRLRKVMG